jgi:hypothetical protein
VSAGAGTAGRAAGAILMMAAALLALLPSPAVADRWEVRREVREGVRSIEAEKREARREIRRCQTRECARREIREGHREVERERREARREVRRELREERWEDHRYSRDRDDDLLKGVVIGAAVVGIAAAVANSGD